MIFHSYMSLPGICKLANFLVYLRSLGRHSIVHHCTQMITEDSPSRAADIMGIVSARGCMGELVQSPIFLLIKIYKNHPWKSQHIPIIPNLCSLWQFPIPWNIQTSGCVGVDHPSLKHFQPPTTCILLVTWDILGLCYPIFIGDRQFTGKPMESHGIPWNPVLLRWTFPSSSRTKNLSWRVRP